MREERVLVLPDMHVEAKGAYVGGLDMKSYSTMMQYAKQQKYDRVVILGDFLDLGCISGHNVDNLKAVEGTRLARDYAAGRRVLQDLIYNLGAPIWYIEGNHEFRAERLIAKNPQLDGLVNVTSGLRLNEPGAYNATVTWVPFWSKSAILSIGKAAFIHGMYTGPSHAKTHVERFDRNVFYGHLHSRQLHSKVTVGRDDTKTGESLGCLCEYNASYLRGAPTNWQQAFAEFHFQPNGNFNHYVFDLFGNKFKDSQGKLWQPAKDYKMRIDD